MENLATGRGKTDAGKQRIRPTLDTGIERVSLFPDIL